MADEWEITFYETIKAQADQAMLACQMAGEVIAKYTEQILKGNELIVTEPIVERDYGMYFKDFLDDIELPTDKIYIEHFDLLIRAMRIYVEREKTRGSLWAAFDEHDSIHHMRSKLARIIALAESGVCRSNDVISDGKTGKELYMDEVLDLINYAVFALRHILGWKPKVDRTV